ncbi:Signal transduction histidine kinase [Paenibacillus sp. CF384]|nr:Signal transduction histidine kinase [Paenibacillus sp. CF384]
MLDLVLVLAGLVLLLLVLVLILLKRGRAITHDLRYVQYKLNAIIDQDSSEKVLRHTEAKQVQELLTAVNRLLDANRKTKSDYIRMENALKKMIANMSHDLKTPLTVVLGLTETMAHGTLADDPGEQRRLSLKVHEKTLDIINLTNQFFDLARLESGDRPVPLSKINLSSSCRSSILFYYEEIESQGLQVEADIPEEPIYVYGNEDAIGRVLHNLLSNAIRYGHDGGVVGIALVEQRDHVLIEVWDRGIGIRQQDQASIFERLYTLSDSRNQSHQGSGLGLTITKRLVELMEAEISLKSMPNEKTVFTIRFMKFRF